ncbi:hypothetical protein [Bacteroides uniformis]|uniref:hypothetical protein n=1 Tax=Bacteroides uniformis TaxID=820 RepID=UPI0036F26736
MKLKTFIIMGRYIMYKRLRPTPTGSLGEKKIELDDFYFSTPITGIFPTCCKSDTHCF